MNDILAAIEDREALWSNNDDVTGFDPQIDAAVQRALQHNTEPTYERHNDSPEAMAEHRPNVRLIYAMFDPAPTPFLDALHADRVPNMHAPCDRCMRDVTPVACLWVPAGGSVVQIECCFDCHEDLPGLSWR